MFDHAQGNGISLTPSVPRSRAQRLPLLPLLRELQRALRSPLGLLFAKLRKVASAPPHRTSLPALSPPLVPSSQSTFMWFEYHRAQNCTQYFR